MVVYEVNLAVENDAAEEFAVWLRHHIPDVLAIDGFVGATWFFEEPGDGVQRWSVHYRVESWPKLQAYFDHHATRMREEGLRLFGGRFEATRRVLFEREAFGEG